MMAVVENIVVEQRMRCDAFEGVMVSRIVLV